MRGDARQRESSLFMLIFAPSVSTQITLEINKNIKNIYRNYIRYRWLFIEEAKQRVTGENVRISRRSIGLTFEKRFSQDHYSSSSGSRISRKELEIRNDRKLRVVKGK